MSLVIALDATVIVPVLPTIASSLHGSTTATFWVGSAYLLTSAIFQPFIIALSDEFGRRLLLFLCSLSFSLGTLICCLSRSFSQLLPGRAIQGVGGGGIMALNNVIISDIIPLRQRPLYLAAPQLAWAIGTITGPLLGGLFAEHTKWRWIFYLNFPFCLVGVIMIPFAVRLNAQRPSLKDRMRRMDWIGMSLFTVSITSILVPLTWGGVEFAWYSWQTLVPLILGVIILPFTIFYEHYIPLRPFLQLSLFDSRSANAAYFGSLIQGLLLFCTLYYVPVYFEAVKNFGPVKTGLSLMPATATLVPMSIITGAAMRRLGRFRWAIWSGWLITIPATGLLILLNADTTTHSWVLILIVVGVGYGLLLMSLNYCTQVIGNSQNSANAAVMYTFLRSCGICLGVALGGAVFQNQLVVHLRRMHLPTEIASDAMSLISTLTGSRETVAPAILKSFHNVCEFMLAFATLGGVLSIFIESASPDADLNSEHVVTS
ncbi:uncharacterized protein TRUGW13939_09729 [Talaromyces rugulosus]|uniref:Major facilitator superfamily (MFS) profile domain-containing protein n=1 Tax=Talaromyces rugulosus TaxID=121627 RepID=A0A7H8R9F4_TALRU|nr:uncharacterized protein TRUGW13939_09729 [Talaromyces rugulosus]QKX62568.1 hypothetical protein TRUGW13939_09729 [Talaromyces rugulosus]